MVYTNKLVSVIKLNPFMRQSFLTRLLLSFLVACTFFSCKKTTDTTDASLYDPERLKEVMPLQVGKYISYRLDSLVFVNFQRTPEIHSYKVKHVVDALVTDNLNRPSYRIYRYITSGPDTDDWQPNGSYFITPLSDRVEVIDDNLRVIKLFLPIKEGFEWKGNSYLPVDPYGPYGFNFSNDDDMKNWKFYYDTPSPDFSYDGNNYTDVYTVEQQADSSNVPVTPLQQVYAYKTRSVEKYARNIGLVYKELALWEYQPSSGPNPYYVGFGIKMWMIDHN
jgi:hypothetical protein